MNSYDLPTLLQQVRELSQMISIMCFEKYTETDRRLLSEIEIEAHRLSESAARKKNHPYNPFSHVSKKKSSAHQKLQSAPWRNTPVDVQVISLVLDFGLEEAD